MTVIDEKEIKETVRRFILGSVNIPDFKDDDNLFESGIVNSLFAVQLMTFIEMRFALKVGPDDLDIKNFKSLNAMTAFVHSVDLIMNVSDLANFKPVLRRGVAQYRELYSSFHETLKAVQAI